MQLHGDLREGKQDLMNVLLFPVRMFNILNLYFFNVVIKQLRHVLFRVYFRFLYMVLA